MAWKYAVVLLVAIVIAHIEAKKGMTTKTWATYSMHWLFTSFVYCNFWSSRSDVLYNRRS